MSSAVFPSSLPGMQFFSNRTPVFKTSIQEAQSGKETRIARMSYPRFKFELSFELLRDNLATSELQTFMGFFGLLQGQYDTFLYTDPYWHSVTAMQFGTGDGSTTAFQLTATNAVSGGYGVPEAIQNLNGAPQIYVNGTLQTIVTNYSISGTGVITFIAAPAAAAVITWSGSWYYRCRFTADELTPREIMKKWWELQKVEFISVKL